MPSGGRPEGVEQQQDTQHDEDGETDQAEPPVTASAAPARQESDQRRPGEEIDEILPVAFHGLPMAHYRSGEYTRSTTESGMTRRLFLIGLMLMLAACAEPLPVQIEGQGGSSTKTKLKVKLSY